jgi:hypothetical protein
MSEVIYLMLAGLFGATAYFKRLHNIRLNKLTTELIQTMAKVE